ncbi:MAG: hypothetical protein HC933_10880 [Pleurocapsa sp. SU_196_0]|nr:hypothetical protein [Pleurocapsa sp. SU_196_0]
MKGSTWIFAIVTFGAAILTFSRVYGEVVRYLTRPTPEGLVTIIGFSVLLLFCWVSWPSSFTPLTAALEM